MPNLEPEEILKFDFTPGIDIGFLPQEPEWGMTSLMQMGFLPKQGTSFLPYDLEDLVVTGASPPEVTSPPPPPPPTGPPPGPPPPGPPGTLRPHNPSVTLVKRESPQHYLKSGIRFRLYLDAAGEVGAHVESKFKLGHAKDKEHVISKKATRKLKAGYYEITLEPNSTAKVALKQHKSLEADVLAEITYEDKTTKRLKKAFKIAPAPVKHKKHEKAAGHHATVHPKAKRGKRLAGDHA